MALSLSEQRALSDIERRFRRDDARFAARFDKAARALDQRRRASWNRVAHPNPGGPREMLPMRQFWLMAVVLPLLLLAVANGLSGAWMTSGLLGLTAFGVVAAAALHALCPHRRPSFEHRR